MLRRVDIVWTDVSEEYIFSIFWVEKSPSEESAWAGGCRLNTSWMFSTCGSVCSHLPTLVPRSRIFLPWKWRRYVPPKRRFTQDLHGATSQKTVFFIVTAVKTSYLTHFIITERCNFVKQFKESKWLLLPCFKVVIVLALNYYFSTM
jgi:hypothetical protein